jgi:rRNA small subunit pseudouridine methyltransferase Nep1
MSGRDTLPKHAVKAEQYRQDILANTGKDSNETQPTEQQPATKSTTPVSNQLNTATAKPEKAKKEPKLIVVMSNACLETVKIRDKYELLSADTHTAILSKLNKPADAYRPDILHQCLLSLLDSPLNKAGYLKVYIETTTRTLIEVNPQIRIPRTFKRFAGLMVQLLRDLKIKSADGKETLLKIIKNPVTQYFPPNTIKLQTSVQGELTNINEYVKKVKIDTPVAIMIGAHSHGQHEVDWAEDTLALSQYPCSASVIIGRVCGAFEQQLGIL